MYFFVVNFDGSSIETIKLYVQLVADEIRFYIILIYYLYDYVRGYKKRIRLGGRRDAIFKWHIKLDTYVPFLGILYSR